MMKRLSGLSTIGLALGGAVAAPLQTGVVLPELVPHLVAHYDFEHPVPGDPDREADQGRSGTAIDLVNGGAAMRVPDGAHPASRASLQTQQVHRELAGNDDWKAGVYDRNGVASLGAFASATGITVMGWVKPTGTNPNLNSTTPEPDDHFNAVGLFGVLSGDSDGHAVRALLEVMDVAGTQRLVALGRRVDGESSRVLAAGEDWQILLPRDTWTHLAATFDFDTGEMALYRNGAPVDATYTSDADSWAVDGPPEPDRTSETAPVGIKIGGSFPQNTLERNPFNGRLDDLMFFDTALTAEQVQRQFLSFGTAAPQANTRGRPPVGVTVTRP